MRLNIQRELGNHPLHFHIFVKFLFNFLYCLQLVYRLHIEFYLFILIVVLHIHIFSHLYNTVLTLIILNHSFTFSCSVCIIPVSIPV